MAIRYNQNLLRDAKLEEEIESTKWFKLLLKEVDNNVILIQKMEEYMGFKNKDHHSYHNDLDGDGTAEPIVTELYQVD